MNSKKIIVVLMIVAVFVCLAIYVYLSYHYIYTRPQTPQPELSRVIPFNVHGSVVYLTKQEDLYVKISFWGMIALIVVTGALNVIINPFGGSERP